MTDRSMPSLTRRRLVGTAATAALITAARSAFPHGAHAATVAPETTKATLGFIALTDAAPLIIAKEKGIFEKHGLPDVEVTKQASWGALRDNLVLGGGSGGIDGAHILTPLPYLMSLGKVTQNGVPVPISILARLNNDGQGISVSDEFKDLPVGVDSSPLREAFAKKKAAGAAAKAAMTFPGGTHDLWIRYWLAAGGIDPDHDVETIVVPPPQMVANMKVHTMDVFCVGEPWNEQLVRQDIGFSALTTGELWSRHPEKSLGVRTDWVEKNPNAAMHLTMAILEAQQWCDQLANKEEMCAIISKRSWFNVPVGDIVTRAKGEFHYGRGKTVEDSPHRMKFWQGNASYPFRSHDLWFLTENMRWGKLDTGLDTKAVIEKVNREDIWRSAAKELGVADADIPTSTSRGVETFFDKVQFDPDHPEAYLAALAIKRVA